MHPILARSFGGLPRSYHLRQLTFGLIFPALLFLALSRGGNTIPLNMIAFLVVNTLLYPYSRFLYERVMSFLMGDNVLFVNTLLMLFVKFFTMLICWAGAVFIAPIGLVYLYFQNGSARTNHGMRQTRDDAPV